MVAAECLEENLVELIARGSVSRSWICTAVSGAILGW